MKILLYLWSRNPLTMPRWGVSFILQVATIFTLAFGGARESNAMGDFGSILYGFWELTISSYWYSSLEEYNDRQILASSGDTFRDINSLGRLLKGETEPVGLERTLPPGTTTPRPNGEVQCSDFRVVRYTGLKPEKRRFFRYDFPKGVAYIETWGGFLTELGRPFYAKFWIAAIFPEGALPLFNADGVGINPHILQQRLMIDTGYGNGLPTMPPERFYLLQEIPCDGFFIYVVEYD